MTPEVQFTKYKNYDYLTRDEERKLLETVKGSDDKAAERALDRLIRCHMRMAAKIAMNYHRRSTMPPNYDFDDIVQEACIGLQTAAKNFDLEQNVRFATFATYWIKATVNAFIHSQKTVVKLPTTGKSKRIIRYLKTERQKLEAEFGGSVPQHILHKRLAEKFETTEGVIERYISHLESNNVPLNGRSKTLENFDAGEIMDNIADETPNAEELLIDNNRLTVTLEEARKVYETLKPRDKDIYRGRILPPEGADQMTLDELASKYGISKERVRQRHVWIVNKIHKAVKERIDDAGCLQIPVSPYRASKRRLDNDATKVCSSTGYC